MSPMLGVRRFESARKRDPRGVARAIETGDRHAWVRQSALRVTEDGDSAVRYAARLAAATSADLTIADDIACAGRVSVDVWLADRAC